MVAGHRDVSHRLAGLSAKPGSDQFVVAPDGTVEEHQRRAADAPLEILGHLGAGGHEIKITAARLAGDAKPERITGALLSRRMHFAFQVPGTLSGNRKWQHLKP